MVQEIPVKTSPFKLHTRTHVLNKVQYKQEGHDSCDHVMLLVLSVHIQH